MISSIYGPPRARRSERFMVADSVMPQDSVANTTCFPHGFASLATVTTGAVGRVFYAPFVIDHDSYGITDAEFATATGVASSTGYGAVWTADADWQPERCLMRFSGSTATNATVVSQTWVQNLAPGRYMTAYSNSSSAVVVRAWGYGFGYTFVGGAALNGNTLGAFICDSGVADGAWRGLRWTGQSTATTTQWWSAIIFGRGRLT